MNKENTKTEWDLSLLYENPDEEISADIEHAKKAYENFAKKYRDKKSYLEKPAALQNALEELEYLGGEENLAKPAYFYEYKKSLNSSDQEVIAEANQLSQLFSELSTKISFFELSLAQVSDEKKQEFLEADELSHYHKYLRDLFDEAEHHLSEKEENILSLTSLPRYSMWIDGVEKSINEKTVEFEDEEIPISEAFNKIQNLEKEERRDLHDRAIKKLKEAQDFAESEINAIVTGKKISDKLRGFNTPEQATIESYENTQAEIDALQKATDKWLDISRDFYSLKADLLGEDTLTYADRNASIGDVSEDFDFEKSTALITDAYADIDDEFTDIFKRLVAGGQVDVYPKKGKSGGAFCSPATHLPTYVLLNHVDDFNSFMTFSHEMGHAIHSEMSKDQTPLYEGYTIPVAETASTFFEKVAFERLKKNLDQDDQIIALHDHINSKISTIFRQMAFFSFEKELHAQIRGTGHASHKKIAKLLNKHTKNYLGDAFELTEKDGYFFVRVPHFRRYFYTYAYAYGDLLSSAMFEKLQNDSSFVKPIKNFLSAGSSKRPKKLYADLGIDTERSDVYEAGLQSLRDDIETLKELTNG